MLVLTGLFPCSFDHSGLRVGLSARTHMAVGPLVTIEWLFLREGWSILTTSEGTSVSLK